MEYWARAHLTVVSDEDGVEHVQWVGPEDKVVQATMETFLSLFDSCEPTVASLKAAVPASSGWHQHIDLWVEQGLIVA